MIESTNNTMVENIISTLEKAKNSFTSELETIEEEFKKKLEEAKKGLSAKIEETNSQIEYWNSVLAGMPETVKKVRKPRQKKVEEEVIDRPNLPEEEIPIEANESVEEPETVVDTLFEENNEPEEEETSEEVSEDDWATEGVESETETSEEPSESFTDLDDGWPAQPEEWK